MLQDFDLKELELRAWRSAFQDGLWDICLGLLLFGQNLAVALEDMGIGLSEWWVIILLFPAVLVLWAGKKFITALRMGRVKVGPRRRANFAKVSVTIAIWLLLGVIVFALTTAGVLPSGWSIPVPALLWAAVCIIGFSLAGYFLDFSRLYVYGVLYAIPYSLRITFKQNNPDLIWISYFAALVAAGIIVLVGVILLMRFLRDYPLPIEEAPIEEKALERNH